jgi:hypothetical protein
MKNAFYMIDAINDWLNIKTRSASIAGGREFRSFSSSYRPVTEYF